MLRCVGLKLYKNAVTKIIIYAKNAEEKNPTPTGEILVQQPIRY